MLGDTMRQYQIGDYIAIPGNGGDIYPSISLIKAVNDLHYTATVYTFNIDNDEPKLISTRQNVVTKYNYLEDIGMRLIPNPEFHQMFGI
jgi:hypothetical protein